MRAAVVKDFTQPLEITEVPTPEPGPGEVLVASRPPACATPTSTPRTATGRSSRPRRSSPATRASGSSSRSAPACTDRSWASGSPCRGWATPAGSCDYCVDGWETLCEQQVNTGYGRDGAFAEYAVANAAYVAPVPDGIDPSTPRR